jgi:O-antigen/teichoic acid export membrane protein
MLPRFSNQEVLDETLIMIKRKSLQYIRYLFPFAILMLISSQFFFQYVFNKYFFQSYKVFDIYLLLIISRFVFPSTVLMGFKKNKIILNISLIELLINISVSLLLVKFIGFIGVAYGTLIAYFSERIMLAIYIKKELSIPFSKYIPIKDLVIFSSILILVFIAKLVIYQI